MGGLDRHMEAAFASNAFTCSHFCVLPLPITLFLCVTGWRVPVLILPCLLLAFPPLAAAQAFCKAAQSESTRRMQSATQWVDVTLAGQQQALHAPAVGTALT